jgi:hypothetical protein
MLSVDAACAFAFSLSAFNKIVGANPTVRGIQQCSKQSFQPHHPGVSDPPPLDFFFLTNLLEKCYISVQTKGFFTHIVT